VEWSKYLETILFNFSPSKPLILLDFQMIWWVGPEDHRNLGLASKFSKRNFPSPDFGRPNWASANMVLVIAK
jgi:hypothetical protein